MSPVRTCIYQAVVLSVLAYALLGRAEDIVQETATIEFDPAVLSSWDPSIYPAWVLGAGTEDGVLDPVERCWSADEMLPAGRGQCWIDIDRRALRADLALTLLFEAATSADVAVQLWDDTSRVVAIDLFMNIIEEATWFKTHTFVIPLAKYSTASRIVIRRLAGDVKVHGVILTPVLGEAQSDFGELLDLARALGDPLSAENPVVQAVRATSRKRETPPKVHSLPKPTAAASVAVDVPESAAPQSTGTTGLVAYYDFGEAPTNGIVRDKSGNNIDLAVVGKPVSVIPGVSGKAVLLNGSHFQALRNPLDGAREFTISLWFKTVSPTANYKFVAAAWWRGGRNASGWNVGTHYSEFFADNREIGPVIGRGWDRSVSFLKGEWNHLVIVSNGKKLREYINGQMSHEFQATGQALGPGSAMTVGAWMGGFRFRGVMDELRIYRRALGHDEIVSLFDDPGQPGGLE